jgi:CelD/BcsL family acetyltransferase involved in cellulose biosynthesis
MSNEPVSGGGVPWERDLHPVLAALAQVGDQLSELQDARLYGLSDSESLVAVEVAARLQARLSAVFLGVVKNLDDRPGAVQGARAGKGGAATFLVHKLKSSHAAAHRDVATAHALDPDTGTLPGMGAALAAGEVSRVHADVAVKALNRIPAQMRREIDPVSGLTNAEKIDDFLTQRSMEHSPTTTDRLAKEIKERLDPDGGNGMTPMRWIGVRIRRVLMTPGC